MPEKRKILAKYYNWSNNPDSPSVKNIFRALTKCGLLAKCKKTDLICKKITRYTRLLIESHLILSQQRINKNFIKLNNEII